MSNLPPSAPSPSTALAQWDAAFRRDVDLISRLLSLRTDIADEATRDALEPHLVSISSHLSEAEQATATLRSHINSQTEALNQLDHLERRLHAQSVRARLVRDHLPPQIAKALASAPTPAANQTSDPPSTSSVEDPPQDESTSPKPPARKPSQRTAAAASKRASSNRPPPLPRNPSSRTNRNKSSGSAASTPREADLSRNASAITIQSVSKEQLDAAPQYVKGRVTLEALNAVSSRLTSIARAKYAILGKPNSALSSAELSHCQTFREAFCDETDGHQFLTDVEIKGFGDYRMDASVKNAINVLRHVGSLKEVRGKTRARIFLIKD